MNTQEAGPQSQVYPLRLPGRSAGADAGLLGTGGRKEIPSAPRPHFLTAAGGGVPRAGCVPGAPQLPLRLLSPQTWGAGAGVNREEQLPEGGLADQGACSFSNSRQSAAGRHRSCQRESSGRACPRFPGSWTQCCVGYLREENGGIASRFQRLS